MKASKLSDAQKAFILKQGNDGMPVADVCRKAGISQATFYSWRKKYAGLLPTEMRRLKARRGRECAAEGARTSASKRKSCRTSSGESSEALSAVAAGVTFPP